MTGRRVHSTSEEASVWGEGTDWEKKQHKALQQDLGVTPNAGCSGKWEKCPRRQWRSHFWGVGASEDAKETLHVSLSSLKNVCPLSFTRLVINYKDTSAATLPAFVFFWVPIAR